MKHNLAASYTRGFPGDTLTAGHQAESIRRLADALGMTIVREYEDEEYSSGPGGRPQFHRMMDAALSESRPFGAVIVYDRWRFAAGAADPAPFSAAPRPHQEPSPLHCRDGQPYHPRPDENARPFPALRPGGNNCTRTGQRSQLWRRTGSTATGTRFPKRGLRPAPSPAGSTWNSAPAGRKDGWTRTGPRPPRGSSSTWEPGRQEHLPSPALDGLITCGSCDQPIGLDDDQGTQEANYACQAR